MKWVEKSREENRESKIGSVLKVLGVQIGSGAWIEHVGCNIQPNVLVELSITRHGRLSVCLSVQPVRSF